MKQIVPSVEQAPTRSPALPTAAKAVAVAPRCCQAMQARISAPPDRPRQNSIVHTSVATRRANRPAVLNATAEAATISTPALPEAEKAGARPFAIAGHIAARSLAMSSLLLELMARPYRPPADSVMSAIWAPSRGEVHAARRPAVRHPAGPARGDATADRGGNRGAAGGDGAHRLPRHRHAAG